MIDRGEKIKCPNCGEKRGFGVGKHDLYGICKESTVEIVDGKPMLKTKYHCIGCGNNWEKYFNL